MNSLLSTSTLPSSLLIICCALASLNRPDLIPTFDAGLAPKVNEALWKISTVSGIPKTINALQVIHSRFGSLNTSRSMKLRNEKEFFGKVYGSVAEKLLLRLDSYHPRLKSTILNSYGQILADFSVLDEIETETCLIAALIVQGGLVEERQGFSHKRALISFGMKEEQLSGIIQLAKKVQTFVEIQNVSSL